MFYFRFFADLPTLVDIVAIAEVNSETNLAESRQGLTFLSYRNRTHVQYGPTISFALPWHFKESILRREQEYISKEETLFFRCLR